VKCIPWWIGNVVLVLLLVTGAGAETYRHEGIQGECWFPDDWEPTPAEELGKVNGQAGLRPFTAGYRWKSNIAVLAVIRGAEGDGIRGDYESLAKGIVEGIQSTWQTEAKEARKAGINVQIDADPPRFDPDRHRVLLPGTMTRDGVTLRMVCGVYLGARGFYSVTLVAPAAIYPEVAPTLDKILDSVHFDPGLEFRPSEPRDLVARAGRALGSLVVLLLVGYVIWFLGSRVFRRGRSPRDLMPPVS
jgi:hypothetical protein